MSANDTSHAEAFKEQFDAEFEVEDDADTYRANTFDACSPLCIQTDG